ncbi:unnamed protein product, partial [Rotaria sp. Silwood2]
MVEVITTEDMEITTVLNDKMDQNTTIMTTVKSHKRKQMTPSSSQRSSKTNKRKKSSQIKLIRIKTNYKLPMYLKVHPNLLFQALRQQLKHTLKKKSERRFLHHRLQLVDQQCRVDLQRNLWQSYLTLGSEHQVWPNQVYHKAKTNEHSLCQEFVQKHLKDIQLQFDQYTHDLVTQSEKCPTTLCPLVTLDTHIKEFIQLQQQSLSNKLNYQLIRYKNIIHEKELFQTLSNYNLTVDQ